MLLRFNNIFDDFDLFVNGYTAYKEDIRTVEKSDKFVIKMQVPGYAQEDIDVSVMKDKILKISGKKQFKEDKLFQNKSSFEKSWTLPRYVDKTNISAKCINGELFVEIPKIKEDKTEEIRKILVQ